MCPVSFFLISDLYTCVRVAFHVGHFEREKPIKRIQSIVQLYIRQQLVHMTRKSGQTVGNDQRG